MYTSIVHKVDINNHHTKLGARIGYILLVTPHAISHIILPVNISIGVPF